MTSIIRPVFALILTAIVASDSSDFVKETILEDPPLVKKRKQLEKEREECLFKRNSCDVYGPPETQLEPIYLLERLLADGNRNYMGKLCHMHAWQFFLLADRLKPLIERPRRRPDKSRPEKKGHDCHFDYYHRLFFCLEWLNSGAFFRTSEFRTGWGKTSLNDDNEHVLEAIVEGLEDQVVWPDAAQRASWALIHRHILRQMIGVMDIREHEVEKPKNKIKERKTWSGKKKKNTWRNLSIMDWTGRFIYVHVGLAKNDRDMWTSTPLYLQEGLFFSPGEYVMNDGGFEGDGPCKSSYPNPGADIDKKLFNVAFKEVRQGIETAYSRTCRWFPILGNNKQKWNYSDTVLQLAVHAASRLHNFIMNTENLSYDALSNPENWYRDYY